MSRPTVAVTQAGRAHLRGRLRRALVRGPKLGAHGVALGAGFHAHRVVGWVVVVVDLDDRHFALSFAVPHARALLERRQHAARRVLRRVRLHFRLQGRLRRSAAPPAFLARLLGPDVGGRAAAGGVMALLRAGGVLALLRRGVTNSRARPPGRQEKCCDSSDSPSEQARVHKVGHIARRGSPSEKRGVCVAEPLQKFRILFGDLPCCESWRGAKPLRARRERSRRARRPSSAPSRGLSWTA